MKLIELNPEWLHHDENDSTIHHFVDSMDKANGIIFLCPTCFTKNNGEIGTHSVICWNPEVPQTVNPKPGRWSFQGTNFSDLTLIASSNSIQLNGGCNAHFFIRNGEIVFC